MTEEWRSVTGFEGLYEVSDQGNVRRSGRAAQRGNGHGGGARVGHIRKPHLINGGYLVVQLWQQGRPSTCLVHVLVAAAFLGRCPNGHEVNHKDGNKQNNAPDNLEYLTHSENSLHAYRTGLRTVTIEQMIRARRKPRMTISRACGCGGQLETPDNKGRNRRYVNGHNRRALHG